jgi:hypothetical protein
MTCKAKLGVCRRRRLAGKLLAVVDAVLDGAKARERQDAAAAVRQEHRLDGAAAELAEYLTVVLGGREAG